MSTLTLTKEMLPKRYDTLIWSSNQDFTQTSKVDCVAYVPFGSYSIGLNSAFFDLDLLGFYVPIRNAEQNDCVSHIDSKNQTLPSEITHISWLVIDYSFIKDVSNCNMPYSEFANKKLMIAGDTFLNHGLFDYNVLPGENSCKLASVFSDMCYYGNGKITDKYGIIKNDWNELKATLRIYDFCKRRFVSVKGRLDNYMIESGNVRLRSYLYSLNELRTIEEVLRTGELPQPIFIKSISQVADQQVREIAANYYEINAKGTISKENSLIDPNHILNEYIAERLEFIRSKLLALYNNNRNATFDITIGG